MVKKKLKVPRGTARRQRREDMAAFNIERNKRLSKERGGLWRNGVPISE